MMLIADRAGAHHAPPADQRSVHAAQGAAGWADRVATLATTIVDAVAERGECDLVADLAGEMPSLVVAEMFGLPHEVGRRLYQLTEVFHSAPGTVSPSARDRGDDARCSAPRPRCGRGSPKDRPRTRPSGSATCPAPTSRVARLDAIDFGLFFLLMVDAGGDTTRNLVAGGLDALVPEPARRSRGCATTSTAGFRWRPRSCCAG